MEDENRKMEEADNGRPPSNPPAVAAQRAARPHRASPYLNTPVRAESNLPLAPAGLSQSRPDPFGLAPLMA
jgi:hypothetical protein